MDFTPRRTLAALTALAITAAAAAHETDQFSVPIGKTFADITDHLTAQYYDALDAAVAKTNKAIHAAVDEGSSTATIERLQSPEVVTRAVYGEFNSAFVAIEKLEHWVHHDPETGNDYPGRVTGYFESIRNIYQHTYFLLDPRQFWRLWHAATFKAYGVYFGADKIGHFNDMGFVYYQIYERARAAGATHAEAMEKVLSEGEAGFVLGEEGLLGYVTAGSYSNGDLAANYMGLKFYLNLTEPVRLKGRMSPPLLERDGDGWKLAPFVRRDSSFFEAFVSDHFNEAFNPSRFETGMQKPVREAVRARSARILEFYADDNGNHRSREWFERKRHELSTYYGEEYGHRGTDEEVIAIDNTCFEDPPQALAPGERTANGYSALHWAALEGDVAAAADLLDAGADVDDRVVSLQERSADWGSTPLHLAAAAGHAPVVELLLDRGAAIRLPNARGTTPLHVAIDHPAIVEILVDRGADVAATDERGRTPLHWLARYPNADSARRLIDAGAPVAAADHLGRTPLHRAAMWGNVEMMETLLAAGAPIDSTARFGTTPLHFASRCRDAAAVELLLDRGADPDAGDEFGCTALHDAARLGRVEVAEALLAGGADPGPADAGGTTPLHLAARHGRPTVTAVLLAEGAPVNVANRAGLAPLHEAAAQGWPPLIDLLLVGGADVTARDASGQCADELASSNGNLLAALYLGSLRAAAATTGPAMGAR